MRARRPKPGPRIGWAEHAFACYTRSRGCQTGSAGLALDQRAGVAKAPIRCLQLAPGGKRFLRQRALKQSCLTTESDTTQRAIPHWR